MNLLRNISLKTYNTFGIDVSTAFFAEIFSAEELTEALKWAHDGEIQVMILGGGSNVLFTKAESFIIV